MAVVPLLAAVGSEVVVHQRRVAWEAVAAPLETISHHGAEHVVIRCAIGAQDADEGPSRVELFVLATQHQPSL